MYSITVSHHVMIAHSLVGAVFGPAQQLHGATFVVEAGRNTTTEFLAGEIHRRLAGRIIEGALLSTDAAAIHSLRVVLRETPVAWAAYDAPLG